MPAGRPPKPTNIKMLHGNPGHRPLNDAEPQPPVSDQKPPAWLKGRGRKEWKRIAPILDHMGVLSGADADALALLCDALGEYIQARDVVRENGTTYESTTKMGEVIYRARPEVGIASDAWRRVLRMMTDFGMSPSSRSKLSTGNGKQDVDLFEEFLSNGNRGTG